MRSARSVFLMVVGMAAWPRGAGAGICPACVGGYSPVQGVGAYVTEGSAVNVYYNFQRRSRLFQDGRRTDNPGGLAVTVQSVTLGLDYEVRHPVTLGVLVPWVRYEGRMAGPGGSVLQPEASGIGDVTGLARAALWGGAFSRSRASAYLGVKVPTGRTGGGTDAAGNPLPITAQPGSGSWDVLAGLSTSRRAGQWTLFGEVGGRVNGRGRGVRNGDSVRLTGSVSRPIWGAVSGVGELSWEWRGVTDGDILSGVGTGGRTASSTLGVNWIPTTGSRVEVGVRLPLVQRLNGLQLGQTVALTTGGRLYF